MDNNLTDITKAVSQAGENPFFVFRPNALEKASNYFLKYFKGKILYAVKTNPDEQIIRSLIKSGITSFDVASLEEIKRIRIQLPNAELYFMHPVKSRFAIREAYHNYGVRHFSIDSVDELEKLLFETNNAKDLCLFLRLSMPNTYSELTLGEKFGISLHNAPALLKLMRKSVQKLGVSFHVGSQCMHPDAYRIAIRMAGEILAQSKVNVEYFNVGGGFPSIYPGMIPPAMHHFFEAIHEEFDKINKNGYMELLAEPGRAIVAESMSNIVRVELRKGNVLYLNDGTYGGLFDAGTPKFIFPVRLIRNNDSDSSDLVPFSFYGPTCDSLDFMKGPFYLDKNISEGDFIEIGQMGAYGRTMATGFNGFSHDSQIITVSDEPLMTMYNNNYITHETFEVIAA